MPAVASALLTPPMDPVPFTFGDERARPSPRLIAEQTAEMICYLWFSTTLARPLVHTKTRSGGSAGSGGGGGGSLKRRQHHAPSSPQDPARMALQFQPSTTFVDFLLKILETTQVSQSVIVLSLHYIYRLKEHNALTYGQAGSELRVAVVALMLANKFVDDNTYTNKTWSDVSSIELSEVNKMEREFLHGIEYMLFVDEETYLSWLNLLKGLVAAKDKDFRSWQQQQTRMQRRDRELAAAHIRPRVATPRARSSSPTPSARPASFPFTFAVPAEPNPFQYQQPASYSQPPHQQSSPPPSSSSYSYVPPYTSPAHISPVRKRPAEAAFSPATYASHVPLKRPVSMDMSGVSAHTRSSDAFTQWRDQSDIDMDNAPPPQQQQHQPPRRPRVQTQLTPPDVHAVYERPPQSAGGVDASFSRMSLAGTRASPPRASVNDVVHHPPQQPQHGVLVAPCHPDPRAASAAPSALSYYKLACSPLADDNADQTRDRKGRLRYHQPSQYLHPVPDQQLQGTFPPYTAGGAPHTAYSAAYHSPSDMARYAYAQQQPKMPLSANASPLTTMQSVSPAPAHVLQQPQRYQQNQYQGQSQHYASPAPPQLPQLHIPPPRQHQQPRPVQQQQQSMAPILTPPPSGSSSHAPPVSIAPQSTQHIAAPQAQYAQSSPFANAGPPGVRMTWATHAPPAAPSHSYYAYNPPYQQQQYQQYNQEQQQQQQQQHSYHHLHHHEQPQWQQQTDWEYQRHSSRPLQRV